MNRRLKTKALAGLAVVAMLAGLIASPSAACCVLAAHIQIDGLEIFVPSDPNDDNPCEGGAATVEVAYAAPGSFDVTAFHVEGAVELAPNDWWYVTADYLGTIAAASVTGSNPYTVSGLDIVLGFTLQDVDDEDCTPVGDPCSGVVGLPLDGTLDTAPNPDVVSLSGSSSSSTIGDIDFLDTSCGSAAGPYQGSEVLVHYLTAELH